jgi:flagellar hook-associated protein 3 FlgL
MLATLASTLQSGTATADDARAAIDSLQTASDQVSVVQASVGARAARVDLQQGLLENAQTDRTELRSSLEDVDVTQAYTELSKTMTILTATQTSFSKLSQLSLFNYLR